MRAAAQHEVETPVCRSPIDLGCMAEQNGALIVRDVPCRLLHVVRTIEVCVMDAGEVETSAVTLNGNRLVHQHANLHLLQMG